MLRRRLGEPPVGGSDQFRRNWILTATTRCSWALAAVRNAGRIAPTARTGFSCDHSPEEVALFRAEMRRPIPLDGRFHASSRALAGPWEAPAASLRVPTVLSW